MREIVAAIETILPEMSGKITYDDVQIALPKEIDYRALDAAVGTTTWTPIAAGIEATVKRVLGNSSH